MIYHGQHDGRERLFAAFFLFLMNRGRMFKFSGRQSHSFEGNNLLFALPADAQSMLRCHFRGHLQDLYTYRPLCVQNLPDLAG
jgi:hypothetical protein